MLSTLRAIVKTSDIRKKLAFTLGILVLYRLGATIPAPGIDFKKVHGCINKISDSGQTDVYTLLNLFSGGSLLQLSIFAVGIIPYITASIISQLLAVVIPRFEQLQKEGQSGQAKITQYTRYLTIGLALLEISGLIAMAIRGNLLQGCTDEIISNADAFAVIVMVFTMTAGAALAMWFGELITERGIGNGMSLLILSGIAARIPAEGKNILDNSGGLRFTVVLVAILIIIVGVIFVEQGQRRIPVQYAKRMVGRKMYGGSSTYLPIKVNQAGVIPVIFASSFLMLPVFIATLTLHTDSEPKTWQKWVQTYLADPTNRGYIVIFFLLIVFFSYFYVSISFNPEERADDMKRYGGFIPGIRPGRPTSAYLAYILSRITLVGSIYLGMIAVLPNLFMGSEGGLGRNIPFGGTAVLIMVGVGLDTVKQLESQLMQRNYEGFLK